VKLKVKSKTSKKFKKGILFVSERRYMLSPIHLSSVGSAFTASFRADQRVWLRLFNVGESGTSDVKIFQRCGDALKNV